MQAATSLQLALLRATALRQTLAARALSSGKSRAKGKRVRSAGVIPGARFGGKLSTDMKHRGESIVPEIRSPTSVTNPIEHWKIVRGDLVEVLTGPEAGKRGRVLEVVRASNSVVVEGVAFKRASVPQPGGMRERAVVTEHPIYVSRVNVVCPQTDRPTRVQFAYLEDGTRVRVSAESGAIIPRPEILRQRRTPRRKEDGPKDTPSTVVLKRTFMDEDGLYDDYQGMMASVEQATKPGE